MHFDLTVIGGGSGGIRAARLAAQAGKKVALIEDGMIGGTCVNVGCIPKKLYVNAGMFPHYRRLAADYGWDMPPGNFSFARLRTAKDKEIQRLRGIYLANAEKAGVELFHGHARFADTTRVRVGDNEITADTFLIATGSSSTMPVDVPGVELAHNSDAIFQLDAVPEKALIYGGGYIAVELAGVLARLGSRVDLVYRGERILKHFDRDLTVALQDMLVCDGVRLHLNTRIDRLVKEGNAVFAITSAGEKIASNFVLFALGRHANIDRLGLPLAGSNDQASAGKMQRPRLLALDKRGFIEVDEHYRTSIPGICALGDVIGTPQLTPMAIAQAMDFHARHFAPESAPAMSQYVPTCIFTHPPLGTVGMQEQQLQQQRRSYHCFSGNFTPLHLSLGKHHERVFFKILVEQQTDLVAGVHLLGDHAGEIIQTVATAMECGMTKAQLDSTLAIHPTIAEELVTSYQPTFSWNP